MKKFYVYIHTCTANGKKYVGCTTKVKPEYRWREGKGYWHNKYFYSAILKYGWNNFEHEVFEVESEEEMYYAEKYLIAYYHTTESEFGYNHSVGGEKGALGYRHSEEARKKISENNLKRWADPEYRKRVSKAMKGRTFSEDHKRHIAEALKGKPVSEEVRKRIAENNRRRAKDPEFRKKLSESHKGKPRKPFSEDHKRHIAEAAKKRWLDPEYREKLSKACKNRPKVKISLPDGTVLEISKSNLVRHYINKGKEFEYVS